MIPIVDTDEKGILKNITCFALDMDGTVYLGDKWIEGARDFLHAVEKAGKKYVFLTNNSSKDPGTYIKKLGNMGLETGIEKIVTSGMATIDYLKRNFSGKRVYLLGNELLQAEFLEEGIILDPCYTGKAFGGIVEMVKDGRISQDSNVLLLHTGGTPGIFAEEHVDAMQKELWDGEKTVFRLQDEI